MTCELGRAFLPGVEPDDERADHRTEQDAGHRAFDGVAVDLPDDEADERATDAPHGQDQHADHRKPKGTRA